MEPLKKSNPKYGPEKKQGAKHRIIVIQKEKKPLLFLNENDPVFCNQLIQVHILDLIFFRAKNRPMFSKQE